MCVLEATLARGKQGARGVAIYMYIAPKDFLGEILRPTEAKGYK